MSLLPHFSHLQSPLQLRSCLTLLVLLPLLNACNKDVPVAKSPALASAALASAPPALQFPILFVSQVPLEADKESRLSAFANHMTTPRQVPRGGDLMIIYPNGHLRNLTREAHLGTSGWQGDAAIAVREPTVHWSGKKAILSLLLGAPEQGQGQREIEQLGAARWQIVEVEGLREDQTPRFTRLAYQDARYNNLSPIYSSNDDIIFTSDRPRNGETQLYPQLDEYEATPSISGVWEMQAATGRLRLLSHTPSGAFTPMIDSYGRVLFTRWDHLQQDQLADRDRDAAHNQVQIPFKSFNFSSEAANAKALETRDEIFPESRVASQSIFGAVNGYRSNFFTIWQINQDGSNEETLNHLGLHELAFGAMATSFADDPNLATHSSDQYHANQFAVRREGGLFHLREDPNTAGRYYAINAREHASFTTDSIVQIDAPPSHNPEQIQVHPVTLASKTDHLPQGRFRNPLPLSDGRLIASHTHNRLPPANEQSLQDLRLRFLQRNQQSGLFDLSTPLTPGLHQKISWWDGEKIRTFDGNLWELDPVEVRPRPRPSVALPSLEKPERESFKAAGIDEIQLRKWLRKNKLALMITRDQTSRDRADLQQPFNLQVAGGVSTLSKDLPDAKRYTLAHFQIFQATQVRAYPNRPGRRNIAQTIPELARLNFQKPSDSAHGVASSVAIAKDGSTAAFVPAERALSWQTTDAQGNAVVRERNWVSFQAGEIRTCAACHGINQSNQAGFPAPSQKPSALIELLKKWKKYAK